MAGTFLKSPNRSAKIVSGLGILFIGVAALVLSVITKSGTGVGMHGLRSAEAWQASMEWRREWELHLVILCVYVGCIGMIFLATGVIGYLISNSRRREQD